MDSRVEFSDLRGRKYMYSVRRFEDFWADVPGNYIFAKRTSSGWVPLYIGETASLPKRMARHREAWDYCSLRGASFATPARLHAPQFRNFYTPGRDDIFAGFRTCARA